MGCGRYGFPSAFLHGTSCSLPTSPPLLHTTITSIFYAQVLEPILSPKQTIICSRQGEAFTGDLKDWFGLVLMSLEIVLTNYDHRSANMTIAVAPKDHVAIAVRRSSVTGYLNQ